MAAAAISKARSVTSGFALFDFDRMSQTYVSNFIGIRRKLTELLQFYFFKMAAVAIFDLTIGDI
jgi:hypothetical protein